MRNAGTKPIRMQILDLFRFSIKEFPHPSRLAPCHLPPGEGFDKLEFDIYTIIIYNICRRIRQFVTILSIIKTRERGTGALRPFLLPEKML